MECKDISSGTLFVLVRLIFCLLSLPLSASYEGDIIRDSPVVELIVEVATSKVEGNLGGKRFVFATSFVAASV